MKGIIFDFVGVLAMVNEDGYRSDLLKSIDRLIGPVVDDIAFKNEIMNSYNLTDEEFQDNINKLAELCVPYEPIWKLVPGLKRKYKLCIINNGTAYTIPVFKKNFPIDKYFDFFISSAIEKTKKPEAEIYQIALNKLGLEAGEVLFMDDNYQNVETAKKLGMKTIYWDNFENGFKQFLELSLL